MARFTDQKDIFQNDRPQILSLRRCPDLDFAICNQEAPNWIYDAFSLSLGRLSHTTASTDKELADQK